MKKEVKVIQIKLFGRVFVIFGFGRDTLANLSEEELRFSIKGEKVNNCEQGGDK